VPNAFDLLELDGTDLRQEPWKLGLEGIVAKRRDRPYRSGRSGDWIKVKNPEAPAADQGNRELSAARSVLSWRPFSLAHQRLMRSRVAKFNASALSGV
jgi:hypothetical protein